MSLHVHDQNDSSLSTSTTAVASASTSSSTITPSKEQESRRSYLDVPSFRPSVDSTDSVSALSELSFYSNGLQTLDPLVHSISHDGPPTSRSGLLSRLHSIYVANYGALLVLLSQAFGSGMNLSTRLLETPGPHGAPMHPFQILFTRQTITVALCSAYALYSRSIPHFPLGPREVRWLLVSRGLFGFFGVFGMYFSLLYLPLSEATVLTFLAPILTCYACTFFVPGETFSKQQQLAGFISLIGVVFIAQPVSLFSSPQQQPPPTSPADDAGISPPPTNGTSSSIPFGALQPTASQHLTAIGVAMLGVLGSAGAMTSIRAIGTRAHAFISINYFSTWCSIVSLVCFIIIPDVNFRLPGNLTEWGLLASLGVCGFTMQILLTQGLAYGGPAAAHKDGPEELHQHRQQRVVQQEDIEMSSGRSRYPHHQHPRRTKSEKQGDVVKASGTRATSMVYTQMLFALAGDKLVFGVTPGTMSWIGSVLILASAVWTAAARDKAGAVDVGSAARRRRQEGPDVPVRVAFKSDLSARDDGEGVALMSAEEEHGIVEVLEMADLTRSGNEGASER